METTTTTGSNAMGHVPGRDWIVVRRSDHWADEHDCPALAVMPRSHWDAARVRASAETPTGPLYGHPGEEVEVSWEDAEAWLAGFEELSLPAREGAELARAVGTGRALGPLCVPDPVRDWFLRGDATPPSALEPEPPHPVDPWCLLVFRDSSHGGLPMGWLGVLPLRSWQHIVEGALAGPGGDDDDGWDDGEVEASYGSNEHVSYGSVAEWLARFRAVPCSDALARELVLALGRAGSRRTDQGALAPVRLASWGLLPRPRGLWHLFESHAPPVAESTCYAHGNVLGACAGCGPAGYTCAGPGPMDPAMERLGPEASCARLHAPGRVTGVGDVDVVAWDPDAGLADELRVPAHAVLPRPWGIAVPPGPLALGVLGSLPRAPAWRWVRGIESDCA
jgi:hypothetical protein